MYRLFANVSIVLNCFVHKGMHAVLAHTRRALQALMLNTSLMLASLMKCGGNGSAGGDIALLAECLRSKDAASLAYAQWYPSLDTTGYFIPFLPVLDGVFLPLTTNLSAPITSVQKKPVIIGVNKNEGMEFLLYKIPMLFKNLANISNVNPDNFSYSDLKV